MDHRLGTPEEEKYEKDKIYDLPEQSVARWQKRGLVVEPTEAEAAAFFGSNKTERMKRVETPTSSRPAAPAPAPAKVTAQPPPPPAPAPMERSKLDVVAKMEDLYPTAPPPTTPPPAPAPAPAPAVAEPAHVAVDIPADFETLAWPKLKALASRVSGGSVNDRDGALKVLRAEVEKRKG